MASDQRPLRILAMSDIHNNWPAASTLPAADLCIVAGDLTNMGVFLPREIERARIGMRSLSLRYPKILWIPGNHDFGLDSRLFSHLPNVANLLDGPQSLHGLTIRGVSLSVAYNMPSLAYTWCHMTTDPEAEARAFDIPPCDILVSHSPPFGHCDNDGFDLTTKETCHIGSVALTAWIEHNQPAFVICGHSHGGAGEATLGRTRIINVAQRAILLEIP